MTKIEKKANQVFQSGLAFRIYNKPVNNDYLWDIKIFWQHMEYNGKDVYKESIEGFDTLEECLDDIIRYIDNEEYK